MWKIYWDKEIRSVDSGQKVMETVEQLNNEYKNIHPIFVQVENESGDRMCIGIGSFQAYSVIDYFPAKEISSKCIRGENSGEETVCFFMGEHESEFYLYETIQYSTALKVLNDFVINDTLTAGVEWIED